MYLCLARGTSPRVACCKYKWRDRDVGGPMWRNSPWRFSHSTKWRGKEREKTKLLFPFASGVSNRPLSRAYETPD